MNSVKIKLMWPVSRAGYSWVTGNEADDGAFGRKPSRWLTDSLTEHDTDASFVEIEPFSVDPALFLNFCLADPSEESIKDFADRYGKLGGPVERRIRVDDSTDPSSDNKEAMGESFADWTREIESLKLAVQLCFSILEKHRRKDVGVSMFLRGSKTDSADRQEFTLSKIEIPDVEIALAELRDLISGQLECSLGMQKYSIYEDSWLRLVLQPPSLLSGLWLQFAIAASENKFFRQCKQCLRWFEIEPGIRRKSRIFCSDSCKYKAYQERQDTAVRLTSEGLTVDEIARRIGSDPRTVQRWIEAPKGVKEE